MADCVAAQTVWEICGNSLRLFWRNLLLFLLVGALPTLLLMFVMAVAVAVGASGMTTRVHGELQMARPGAVQIAIFHAGWLVSMVGQILVVGALTAAVADRCANRRTGFARAYERAWRLLWRNVLAWLLFALIVMTGFLLLVVPGLIALVYLVVVGPAVIVERLGPVEALRRSHALVRGHFWRVVGVGLALLLLLFALQSGLGLVEWALSLALASIGEGAAMLLTLLGPAMLLLHILLMPLFLLPPVLLYLDLRARQEGLDRATLAAELAQ